MSEHDDAAALAAITGDKPEPIKNKAKASDTGSLLTQREIDDAKAKAKDKVHAAMKQAEIDRIIDEETRRLQREQGKRTGRVDMDELVTVSIDLAAYTDRFVINGEPYYHGHTYTIPRHMAETMRETMQASHRHQQVIDGKDVAQQLQMTKSPTISGAAYGDSVEARGIAV